MDTIQINPSLEIPMAELHFAFSRSPGPGGQNVNKVATKVTLNFDVAASKSLSDTQKAIIARRLSTRITRDGMLHITSSSERSQKSNKEEAVARFAGLLADALRPRKPRKKTRPSAGSRERRLKEKAQRSQTKSLRRGRVEHGE